MIAIEQLTPEEREAVQEHYLRRWLALRLPKGTSRATDPWPPKRNRWPLPWKTRTDLWPATLG